AIDQNYSNALNYIGYTYAEQGIKLDEAEQLIKKAASLDPDNGYITDSLGWVYYQKGDLDKAQTQLERAYQLVNDDPTITEHLGDIYLKKGLHKKALEMYKKAVELLLGKTKDKDQEKDLGRIKEKIEQMGKKLEHNQN
ncbi:MAG: tetratricopeptide repeat protein, partial [Deltaproteobacteria bacterium]|nr:tetratricopeptide repeat protein [Deltaproteobacteria bacterium]